MERKNMLWGWLLIIIGGLFLLDYFEYIDFSIRNLLRLWPILLIMWGVYILPIKRSLKHIGILVILLGGLVLATTMPKKTWRYNYGWHQKTKKNTKATKLNHYAISYPVDDQTLATADLDISVGAAILNIDRPSEQYWIDFEADSDLTSYQGSMTTNGDKAKFIIDSDDIEVGIGKLKKATNKANLRLNKHLIWNINIDAGAAEINADLSQLKVQKLDVNSGVSSIALKIGDLQKEVHIEIDNGVSSAEIEIPIAAYCTIHSDGLLNNLDAGGFKKVDGHYITADVQDTDEVQKIYIEMESALSSVEIHRK